MRDDTREFALEQEWQRLIRCVDAEFVHDAVDADWPKTWEQIIAAWKVCDFRKIGELVHDAIHQHAQDVAEHNLED